MNTAPGLSELLATLTFLFTSELQGHFFDTGFTLLPRAWLSRTRPPRHCKQIQMWATCFQSRATILPCYSPKNHLTPNWNQVSHSSQWCFISKKVSPFTRKQTCKCRVCCCSCINAAQIYFSPKKNSLNTLFVCWFLLFKKKVTIQGGQTITIIQTQFNCQRGIRTHLSLIPGSEIAANSCVVLHRWRPHQGSRSYVQMCEKRKNRGTAAGGREEKVGREMGLHEFYCH